MSHFLAVVINPKLFYFSVDNFVKVTKVCIQSVGRGVDLSKNLVTFRDHVHWRHCEVLIPIRRHGQQTQPSVKPLVCPGQNVHTVHHDCYVIMIQSCECLHVACSKALIVFFYQLFWCHLILPLN